MEFPTQADPMWSLADIQVSPGLHTVAKVDFAIVSHHRRLAREIIAATPTRLLECRANALFEIATVGAGVYAPHTSSTLIHRFDYGDICPRYSTKDCR